ncbi:phosphoribosylanthranilate isomerase [Sediminicola sp. 1XM1-17]|uniref:phosphoribosylanthranilate isomerase n=1 Tax=Sediminicola sp. 1XM1-17 TaxID=3127702 RepID=UPI003077DC7B
MKNAPKNQVIKLKVCGMKYADNMEAVAKTAPDYLGFIFWEPSKRAFSGDMGAIPSDIKRVGVFVDAKMDEILQKVSEFDLQAVQLHGKETSKFCKDLKENYTIQKRGNLEIIKVFSILDDFDFSILADYEAVCDYFLFDTKGKLPGGNGYTFSWQVLKNYPSTKPYFLSGGIGLEEIDKITTFLEGPESKYCYAIDVNSKFELEPGLKQFDKLNKFVQLLRK